MEVTGNHMGSDWKKIETGGRVGGSAEFKTLPMRMCIKAM